MPDASNEQVIEHPQTKYAQLALEMRRKIESGQWLAGDRLPSRAEMLREHGVNQAVLERAHAVLEREGLIVREQGRGTFVARPAARVAAAKPLGLRGTLGVLGTCFGRGDESGSRLYWSHLLDGIRAAAQAAGYEVALLSDDAARTGWEKVDGVLAPENVSQLLLRSRPLSLPFVTLLFEQSRTAGVTADDEAGAQLAVRHLQELGHRRIGYLLVKDRAVLRARYNGYRKALRAEGIRASATWTRWIENPPEVENYFYRVGQSAMRGWLHDNWAKTGCTALLCQNDQMALGALAALREAKIRVPADVSLVGFDGTVISEYSHPTLTTIEVPLHAIGARGVELLLAQIAGDSRDVRRVVLPVKFKKGESTASLQSEPGA